MIWDLQKSVWWHMEEHWMIRTFRVVLQHVDVKVCIDDEDVQLTLEWQELSRHDFHM
jgi:hypothetical protein